MYGCESWTLKKAECQRINVFKLVVVVVVVVVEKALESPLDCKEIKPVNPKGKRSWLFIGRTDAEVPILWPPDVKNWLIRQDSDAGKDWRQEEKGTTEDEMVRLGQQRMASPTQRTWISTSSRSWWWTGKPGVLQSMGLQRVGHTWVTELNWYIMSGLQRIILIFLLSCFFNIKIFLSISVSINLLVQQNSVTYYRNWWMWQKCKKEKENIVLSLCFHQFITSVTLQQSSLLKICSTISIPTWLPKCS